MNELVGVVEVDAKTGDRKPWCWNLGARGQRTFAIIALGLWNQRFTDLGVDAVAVSVIDSGEC